jgi:hypothetical protein
MTIGIPSRARRAAYSTILAALSIGQAAFAADPRGDSPSALYAALPGTVALENDRVLVSRWMIPPGKSTGREAHGAHQLLIFVKGGVLASNSTGRHSLWPDGRVLWLDKAEHDDGSTNVGRQPIEILWVTVKPGAAPSSPASKPSWGYLNYPNIAGEDVLENDWMIVQRFKMKPGEWEGVHAHNPNTFYVFIKGGQWVSKSKANPSGIAGSAIDGTIAWMDTIDLSEEHQSGNTGTNETEVVWVSLKR